MQCPKCGHPQADGRAECERCGVIFAKIPLAARPAAAENDTPAEAADDAPAARPAPAAGMLVALAVCGAALWWLNFPRGGSTAGATQVNAEKGYAYAAPSGWLALTPQTYDELIKPYRDRFPAGLRQFIEKAKFDVGHLRVPENGSEFAPSINLIALPLPGRLPELTDAERQKATAAITAQMSAVLPSYTLQNSRVVEVDGLKSLQLSGMASLTVVDKPSEPIYGEAGAFGLRQVVGRSEAVTRDLELKALQTFVPGKRFGYLLTCNYLAADPHDSESTCRQVLGSFRVTDRPARFGGVAMGALNGGLLAAAGFLFFALLRRVGGR